MHRQFMRGVVFVGSIALALPPPPAFAQALKPGAVAVEASATEFTVAQLDALLAPIALYPDQLLTQMLMASTYPLQVVAASRWLTEDGNKDLKGEGLEKALQSQNWDASVKSIVAFPQVLAMLNDHLDWTQQLDYAMANNQRGPVLVSLYDTRHHFANVARASVPPDRPIKELLDTLIAGASDLG